MEDNLNRMLDSYILSTGGILKKGSNSLELILDSPTGKSSALIYTLIPGIRLTYYNINAQSLPDSDKDTRLKELEFNYCINGRIELMLADDTYIYIKENDFCINQQESKSQSFFPLGYYNGFSLSIDTELPALSSEPFLDTFELDISRFKEIYFNKRETYISAANERIRTVTGKLWSLLKNPSLFYMRLYTIELLHILLDSEACQMRACTFYTNIQVRIAKKVEEIITADLRCHIPIRQLADQFSVSETSLKNYFRGVYGQNISDYLRKRRMIIAAGLLTQTKISIADISHRVGYTKQGRFAAVFRNEYGMSPLEYRRSKHLENQEINTHLKLH